MIDYDALKPVLNGMITYEAGLVTWSIYGTSKTGICVDYKSIDSELAIELVLAQFLKEQDDD